MKCCVCGYCGVIIKTGDACMIEGDEYTCWDCMDEDDKEQIRLIDKEAEHEG